MVEGGGFEPPKVEPADLQSDPFGRSGTPPLLIQSIILAYKTLVKLFIGVAIRYQSLRCTKLPATNPSIFFTTPSNNPESLACEAIGNRDNT